MVGHLLSKEKVISELQVAMDTKKQEINLAERKICDLDSQYQRKIQLLHDEHHDVATKALAAHHNEMQAVQSRLTQLEVEVRNEKLLHERTKLQVRLKHCGH